MSSVLEYITVLSNLKVYTLKLQVHQTQSSTMTEEFLTLSESQSNIHSILVLSLQEEKTPNASLTLFYCECQAGDILQVPQSLATETYRCGLRPKL